MRLVLAAPPLAALVLSGCAILGPGYIGPVHPPVLDVPVLVGDLRAVEYNDQLVVEFTISKANTEGQPLKSLRSVDLYAGPTAGDNDPNSWFRTATHYVVPGALPGPFKYNVPAQAWFGKDLCLYVRSTGSRGKVSLWSLPYTMSVSMPLAQPTSLTRESRKDGVHLAWKGPGPKYQVMRSAAGAMLEVLGQTDKPEYLDDSAQFGTSYQYRVLTVADDRHQSLISDPSEPITPVDIFPPEVPAGVTANPGVNAIELQWELNTEADFRGYDVFRSVDNGPFEKVASLIPAATYHDADVQAGKTYRYQVSAVDLLGNPSKRSDPVEATLQ